MKTLSRAPAGRTEEASATSGPRPASRGRRSGGFTLLELIIVASIMALVILGASSVLRNQVDVVGHVENNDFTVAPAQSTLWRIRNELLTAVNSPSGVTSDMAPFYDVYAPAKFYNGSTTATPAGCAAPYSYMIWRPSLGVPPTTTGDPVFIDYNNWKTSTGSHGTWTGCLATSGVLYANYAKVLWVDTSNAPYNMLRLETITASPTAIVNGVNFSTASSTTWVGPNGTSDIYYTTGNWGTNGNGTINANNSTTYKIVLSEILAGNGGGAEMTVGKRNTDAQRKITQNVAEFRIFEGASTLPFFWTQFKADGTTAAAVGTDYASGASVTASYSTKLLGFYLRVEHGSVSGNDWSSKNVGNNGRKTMTSNWDNANINRTGTATAAPLKSSALRMTIFVPPEALTNSSGGPTIP